MSKPKALVLSGDGINCDRETAWALSLAGFDAVTTHTGDLLQEPERLSGIKLVALPGGFSFGDEIASGKVLAVKLKERLKDVLFDYISSGNLLIGICNGFQVLVQLGLLPYSEPEKPRLVSLRHNSGGKFINKWTTLSVDPKINCPFLTSLTQFDLPIRHGEGRLCLAPEQADRQKDEAQVKARAPLRYDEDINGSFDRIAALSNERGNVFGLMPHPEAFVRWTQHPSWTERRLKEGPPRAEEAPGLTVFTNAARSLS